MFEKKYLSTITLALVLVIFASFQTGVARADEGSEYDMSYYEALLNPDDLFAGVDPTFLGASEDEMEIFEIINQALGFTTWETVSVDAMQYGGLISVRSIAEYVGENGTMFAEWIKVPPTKPRIINGFSSENLLGLAAVGDFPAETTSVLDWVLDSEKFEHMLATIAGDDKSVMMGWKMTKPVFNAVRQTMKKEIFSYMQNEVVFAAYYNSEFTGWDRMYEADNFTEGSPVKVMGAFALDKPGIAGSVNDIIKAFYTSVMAALDMGFDTGYDPSIDILMKPWNGYDIYYVDIDDFFQLAWAEYEGVAFISDMNTIENLHRYFNPRNAIKVTPRLYNTYGNIGLGNIVCKFIKPFEQELREELEDMREYEGFAGIEEIEMAEWALSIVDKGCSLGNIEIWNYDEGNRFVIIMNMKSTTGPVILDAFEMLERFGEYLFGSGGCFT
jgi:hypothetical protein